MKRFNITKGTVEASFLFIISVIGVLIPGWGAIIPNRAHYSNIPCSINALGYDGISVAPKSGKPWWRQKNEAPKEKAASTRTQKKGALRNLSLPNIGLKDPADFSWPYGSEFTYEAEIRNEDILPSGISRTGRLVNRYYADESGAKLEGEIVLRSEFDTMTIGTKVEFDEDSKADIINLYIYDRENFPGMPGGPSQEIRFIFENDGEKVSLRANIPRDAGMLMEPGIYDREFYAPNDGFFFFTGADTPGFTALLLAAVDLDTGKPAKVWVFTGSFWLILGENAEEIRDLDQFLTYITITDLKNCPAETQKWWEDSRKYYNDWRPTDDVRTIIFEGDTDTFYPYYNETWSYGTKAQIADIYKPYGPFAVAYMDFAGRVIRIEQPGGFLCTAADLKEIGGQKAWWGK